MDVCNRQPERLISQFRGAQTRRDSVSGRRVKELIMSAMAIIHDRAMTDRSTATPHLQPSGDSAVDADVLGDDDARLTIAPL
jgi:hypothetical protein